MNKKTGSELYTAARENFPQATPVQYDTFADVFYALDAGKVDAALGFDTNIPLVHQSYQGLAVIPRKVAEYSYGFGTQKNKTGAPCHSMPVMSSQVFLLS